MKTLDPLSDLDRTRMLTDWGILQALEAGLLIFDPMFDLDSLRIQSSSIDMCIAGIRSNQYIPTGEERERHYLTMPARSFTSVELTDKCSTDGLSLSCVSRSSILRLGTSMTRSTPINDAFEYMNLTANSLSFDYGDAIGQLFIEPYDLSRDDIRALDMAIEIKDNQTLEYLSKRGELGVLRNNGKKFTARNGMIDFHISNEAYVMQDYGPIHFKDRKKILDSGYLKRIDISKGYKVKPFEQLIIRTEEDLKLSGKVGIRLRDNSGSPFSSCKISSSLNNLASSWVDQGYGGLMMCMPRNAGRTIYPGDVIWTGQVFYNPKEVKNLYGSEALKSQYQNKKEVLS